MGGSAMPALRIPEDEIDRRGEELYEKTIRAKVETPENIGREIVIDVETGDYEIDADGLAASRRLLARHPEALRPVLHPAPDLIQLWREAGLDDLAVLQGRGGARVDGGRDQSGRLSQIRKAARQQSRGVL